MTKDDVIGLVRSDVEFARALLDEGVELFVLGKPASDNAVLRAFVGEAMQDINDEDVVAILSDARKTISESNSAFI